MNYPKRTRRPEGADNEAIFAQMVWDALHDAKTSLFCDVDGAQVWADKTPKGYVLRAKIQPAGGVTGWHFESKIEVDQTKSYPEQTVIHVQASSALVTTGITDLANPTGGLVTSCPGLWVSTQAVPAAAMVSGTLCWNLPQFPMPVPTNYDDPTNFWIYLGEIS